MIAEIIRLEEDYKYGTFGVLKIDKQVFCATLEPSDLLNMRGKSSIPAQQYRCHRQYSTNFGWTFKVNDCPGRTGILFHAGNYVKDTAGCIILGQYFGKLKDNRGVLNSGNTFKKFMDIMDGQDEFHLTIREVY